MQTTTTMPEAHGTFDALLSLSQKTGVAESWEPHFPMLSGPISRWWIKKGRPVVVDVAAARDTRSLAEMAFSFETWAPRLA